MDPIILLLAAQLLIISAILLTTSKSKIANPLLAAEALLRSWLPLGIENIKEEESVDTDADAATQEEAAQPRNVELVIAEKGKTLTQRPEDERGTSGGKAKRKKKPNLKFNEPKSKARAKRDVDESIGVTEISAASAVLSRSLKWIFILRFIRWALKLVVKRPFKASNADSEDLDGGKVAEGSSRVQQAKLIESNYLIKIIAARKCEKIVRIKVARLNMAILKARQARPLQMIPELAEQDV